MADVLTPAQRTRCMAAIRSKNTRPEMIVRRLVHALGRRFRLHRRDLPARPDLAFPALRRVVFVHGCFWHRHDCKDGRTIPKTRQEFWEQKFTRNTRRDQEALTALAGLGWDTLVVWECQVRDAATLEGILRQFLTPEDGGRKTPWKAGAEAAGSRPVPVRHRGRGEAGRRGEHHI